MKIKNLVSTALIIGVAAFAASSISCAFTASKWGLDAIDTMVTPVDPPLTCGAQIPDDTMTSKRTACTFAAGAHAAQTLDVSTSVSNQLPIRHIIILMKENRSFDHMLGKLHEQGQPGTEAVPPSFINTDSSGAAVAAHHATTTCIPFDPNHQSTAVIASVANGYMNGFVKNAAGSSVDPLGNPATTDGHYVMSEYESADLPFYYWLANTYALNDRHFAPLQSGTYASRNFFMLGTNAGVVDTGISFPDPGTNSIFRTLMTSGYTWGAYSDSEPFSGSLGWTSADPGVHSMQEFYKSLDDGTLPNVVFVDAEEEIEDEHPTADVQVGKAWTRNIYQHAIKSPQWPRMAIVFTYDEAGAFADHVPPPSSCLANAGDSPFTELGPRVPFIMISPWAKSHYVSHVAHDHTAITRFIETIFDLPALTSRDANSDALLDMFDFSCGRNMTPPEAPGSGTGGCKP